MSKKKLGSLHEPCLKAAKENKVLFEKLTKSKNPGNLYGEIRRVLVENTQLLRRLEELL